LHKGCDEGTISKSLDDDGAEVRDTAVRRVVDSAKDEEKVGLGIFERFNNLVALEVLILDTSLVRAQALNSDAAFAGT
jgi:hypothetical protein